MKVMSNKDEKLKLPLIFYVFLAVGIVGVFLGAMGVIGAQNNFDKNANDNANLIEVVNGILEFQQIQLETDEGMVLILKSANYDISELTNKTNDKFVIFQNEIVKIKNDIKNKFPQASSVPQESQSVIAGTPFLTLKMDKSEFVLGDKIIFRGTAQPNDAIIITIKLADRTTQQHPISKTEIINGQYVTEYQTSFDDAPGTWTAYARQTGDTTKTLSFKVE